MALVTYNLKTDFGALGDGVRTTDTVTLVNGSNVIVTGSNHWTSPADLNKWVGVTTNDLSGGGEILWYYGIITGVTAPGNSITLDRNFSGTAFAAQSKTVGWGTNDTAAFTTFNTTALTNQTSFPTNTYQLDIPAGIYVVTTFSSPNNIFCMGLHTVTTQGAGAASTIVMSLGTGEGTIKLQSGGSMYPTNAGVNSSSVQTVSAGATTVTVSDGTISIWSGQVGRMVMIGGLDLAAFGEPITEGVLEYVRITNISGNDITFTPALRYSYKSTWPRYGTTHPYAGGPATLFQITPEWDAELTHNDWTVAVQGPIGFSASRSITYNRMTIEGDFGIVPTFSQTVTYNDVSMPTAGIEMDKLVDVCIFNGCTLHQAQFQTWCANTMYFTDTTFNAAFTGSALNTIMDNVTITAATLVGSYAYGGISTFTATDCHFNGGISGGGVRTAIDEGTWLLQSGVIKIPQPPAVGIWGLVNMYFEGAYINEGVPFRILDMDISGGYLNLYTDLGITGWPALTHDSGPLIYLHAHPCPNLKLTNCDGDANAVDFSQAGAYGRPIFSYSKRTYTSITGVIQGPSLWGKVTAININVITPFGTPNTRIDILGQFVYHVTMPNYSDANMVGYIRIDVGTAGLRTLTLNAARTATIVNKQTNDSFDLIDPNCWFTGESQLSPVTIGVTGINMTVEFIMDQEIEGGPVAAESTISVSSRFNVHRTKAKVIY